MKHNLYEPEGYEGCAACRVCKGAEASLASECPGKPMTELQSNGVQNGRIDFINGKWIYEDSDPR